MHTVLGLAATDTDEPSVAALWYANAVRLAERDLDRQALNRIRLWDHLSNAWLPVSAASINWPEYRTDEILKLIDMAFHPSRPLLWIATRGGQPVVFDFEHQTLLKLPLPDPNGVRVSALHPSGLYVAIGFHDGRVARVNLETLTVHDLAKTSGSISALQFSKDGGLLAIGGPELQVWDANRDAILDGAASHSQSILRIDFSPEAHLVSTACRDGLARVFMLRDGRLEVATQMHPVPHISDPGFLGTRRSPALLVANGGLLTLPERSLRKMQWTDTASGKTIRELPAPSGYITAVTKSSDGAKAAISGNPVGRVYATETGDLIADAIRHKNGLDAGGDHLVATGSCY